jgi:hypothetical protein
VRLPDGRVGGGRAGFEETGRVRVRRKNSSTWMSPRGYARYLRVTLSKMRKRQRTLRRSR